MRSGIAVPRQVGARNDMCLLSLREARFLAYASEQAPRSRRGLQSIGIATPRQIGARNDRESLDFGFWDLAGEIAELSAHHPHLNPLPSRERKLGSQ
jgi:hypothetical protein